MMGRMEHIHRGLYHYWYQFLATSSCSLCRNSRGGAMQRTEGDGWQSQSSRSLAYHTHTLTQIIIHVCLHKHMQVYNQSSVRTGDGHTQTVGTCTHKHKSSSVFVCVSHSHYDWCISHRHPLDRWTDGALYDVCANVCIVIYSIFAKCIFTHIQGM